MVFVLVLFFLMIVNGYQTLAYKNSNESTVFPIICSLAYMAIIILIMLSGMDISFLNPKRIMLSDGFNWPVALTLILGLATVLNSARQLAKIFQFHNSFFKAFSDWQLGLFLLALIGGCYLIGTVINHGWFFSDKQHSGIADAKALGVADIHCNNVVIVRMEKENTRYRCATGLVPGNIKYKEAFFPWPDYKEGKSFQFKIILEKIKKENNPRKNI